MIGFIARKKPGMTMTTNKAQGRPRELLDPREIRVRISGKDHRAIVRISKWEKKSFSQIVRGLLALGVLCHPDTSKAAWDESK